MVADEDVPVCRIVRPEYDRTDGFDRADKDGQLAFHAASLIGSILPGNILPAVAVIPAMDIRRAMARNVRRIRAERGLSQEDLADRAGVSVRYLGSIERGTTAATVVVLDRLARALRVKPADLLE
jgi:DNA-binding XRE family transcriptional regulator